ncbi:MAG: cell division protein FtsZ [Odoribacteraceae bacterium]|jgi:cell division protein FtsZ|nr:cell division protein FtsZ [Odoribacteraceae bacterium]
MKDRLINFIQDETSPVIIKVIGVGGGGGNAVAYMSEEGIHDVDFVACNTDSQALQGLPDIVKCIQLGQSLTGGEGAGNNPERGEAAALESLEEIESMLRENTKMAFITATMGGGTGTGAAPVIAKAAKEMNILTVGVVTFPMRSDGPKRVKQAHEGIKRMQEHVDALLVIDNEKICSLYGSRTQTDAFNKANDVLKVAVKGIAEIITLPGYINVDFSDVKTVLTNSRMAIMGAAKASGKGRAERVIAEALNSPLLNISDLSDANDILLSISSGIDDNEISVPELITITSYMTDRVGDVSVIWGVGMDETLGEDLSVTIIATGFPFTEVDDAPVNIPGMDSGTAREETYQNNDSVIDYAGMILKKPDVSLQPDLTVEEIRELKMTPAYTRRRIKVNKI